MHASVGTMQQQVESMPRLGVVWRCLCDNLCLHVAVVSSYVLCVLTAL